MQTADSQVPIQHIERWLNQNQHRTVTHKADRNWENLCEELDQNCKISWQNDCSSFMFRRKALQPHHHHNTTDGMWVLNWILRNSYMTLGYRNPMILLGLESTGPKTPLNSCERTYQSVAYSWHTNYIQLIKLSRYDKYHNVNTRKSCHSLWMPVQWSHPIVIKTACSY